MSRPVVYRVLPAGWAVLQHAERNVLNMAEVLSEAVVRDLCCEDASCDDCRAAAADHLQAAEVLRTCAARLHALWLPREQDVPEEDGRLMEALVAFDLGDEDLGRLDDENLPEAGLRINGPGLGMYMRFADSTSSEEPELLLIEELPSE